MLIDNYTADILFRESRKVMKDPLYKSEDMYFALSTLITHYFRFKRYLHYPIDVLDEAELSAIQKVYKALPKYKQSKADEARHSRGLDPDEDKGIYRFLEIVIGRDIISTFNMINRKQEKLKRRCSLGYYTEDGSLIFDIAAINSYDVCAEIDKEEEAKRAVEFNKKLDKIVDDYVKVSKKKERMAKYKMDKVKGINHEK